MREDQIAAAALDVQARADAGERDRRAFDVPAGAARTERRGPAGFAGPLEPAAAGRRVRRPCRGGRGHRPARRTTAAWCRGHSPTRSRTAPWRRHGSTRRGTRRPRPRRPHPRPASSPPVRPPRRSRRWRPRSRAGQHAQGRHVLAEQLGLAVAEFAPADAVAVGPFEQRIVHIGDVLHVVHGVPGVQPQAVHEVEGQIGRGMAQMRGVVGGDATHVHGGGRPRGHRAYLTVGAVVQPQLRTRPSSTGIDGADHDRMVSTLRCSLRTASRRSVPHSSPKSDNRVDDSIPASRLTAPPRSPRAGWAPAPCDT